MEIINYIFYLGINYITFSVIWFFLTSLPRLVIRSSISNTTSSYILKTIQYYLIAVITSAATLEFMRKNSELSALFVFSGGFILFIYLAGKLEKNKMLFLLKSFINKNQSSGLALTTSRVCVPIDPVDTSNAILFITSHFLT